MFLSEFESDLYRRLGYASSPATEVTTRLRAFINEVHRKIVATPGMSPLRDSTLSVASTASQEYLALPPIVGRIKAITDRSGGTILEEVSLQTVRAINPEQTQGYPERFALLGWRGVTVQPSDASSIFVKSTSASDTGTAQIIGFRTGGYRAQDVVTMTGTTAVDLGSYSDWEQIEAFNLSAAAVGTVTLHEDSGSGTTLATIPIGAQKAKYKHILLDPVPDSSRTYHIDFERRIEDLALAHDEVLIPDDFAYVLLAGVRALEYERRQDARRRQDADQEFRQGMADLLYFVQTTGVPHTRPSRRELPNQFGSGALKAGLMFGTALGNTIGTPTTGDVIYGDANGDWVSLGIGSTNQVLIVSSGLPSWGSAPVTTHALLSADHSDTLAATVSRGSLVVGNSTPAWSELVIGAANRVLGSDGTDAAWVQADHGAALTGLTDDDHTQYALLAGRSGGQTVHGGTGASDNLTFQSTSNATKGNIVLEECGAVVIGGETSATELRLLEPSGSGTNYTGFVAPALAGNVIYTLPTADGSNGQVLQTDGSAALSWASAVPKYGVTLADADNTASEITVLTCTVSNAMADGDVIKVDLQTTLKNNKGTSGSVGIDFLYGGVEVDVASLNMDDNANEGFHNFEFTLIRNGSNAVVTLGSAAAAVSNTTLRQTSGATLTAPTFTASQTLSVKVTLSAADATFYFRPEAGAVRHFN